MPNFSLSKVIETDISDSKVGVTIHFFSFTFGVQSHRVG